MKVKVVSYVIRHQYHQLIQIPRYQLDVSDINVTRINWVDLTYFSLLIEIIF